MVTCLVCHNPPAICACRKRTEPTTVTDGERLAKALRSVVDGAMSPRPTGDGTSITLHFVPTTDPELTCIACHVARQCAFEAQSLPAPGNKAWVGIHAACLERYRAACPAPYVSRDTVARVQDVYGNLAPGETVSIDGHDAPCHFCGKPCSRLAGNPNMWPVALCHADAPGVVRWHHAGCVSERLASASAMHRRAQAAEARVPKDDPHEGCRRELARLVEQRNAVKDDVDYLYGSLQVADTRLAESLAAIAANGAHREIAEARITALMGERDAAIVRAEAAEVRANDAEAMLRRGMQLFEGDDVKLAWIAEFLRAHSVATIPRVLQGMRERLDWYVDTFGAPGDRYAERVHERDEARRDYVDAANRAEERNREIARLTDALRWFADHAPTHYARTFALLVLSGLDRDKAHSQAMVGRT